MLKIENINRIKGYELNIKGFDFNVSDVNENLNSYIFTIKARLTVHAPKTIILKKERCELGYYELQEYGCPRYHLWHEDMMSPHKLRDQFQTYLNSL